MIDISRTRAGNYVTAVMLVAIATVLQALAIRFGGVNLPLVLYYPLLAGAAWATSFLFGMASTVVSGLLVWTLFLSDPAAYTQPLPDRLVRLGTFVLICALVCAIASMLRHARFTSDAALRREAAARRRLEAVLQALPHGVIATDTNGRLTYLNAAAAALVGCRPDDAMGRAARRAADRRSRRPARSIDTARSRARRRGCHIGSPLAAGGRERAGADRRGGRAARRCGRQRRRRRAAATRRRCGPFAGRCVAVAARGRRCVARRDRRHRWRWPHRELEPGRATHVRLRRKPGAWAHVRIAGGDALAETQAARAVVRRHARGGRADRPAVRAA